MNPEGVICSRKVSFVPGRFHLYPEDFICTRKILFAPGRLHLYWEKTQTEGAPPSDVRPGVSVGPPQAAPPWAQSYQWLLSAGRLIKSDDDDIDRYLINPSLITLPYRRSPKPRQYVNAPGREVPFMYSTSWNRHFWRVLPLKSEKLTFAVAPRLILGGL